MEITAQALVDDLKRRMDEANTYFVQVQEEYRAKAFLSGGRLEQARQEALNMASVYHAANAALRQLELAS